MQRVASHQHCIEDLFQRWSEVAESERVKLAHKGYKPCLARSGEPVVALDPLVYAMGLLGLQDWRWKATVGMTESGIVRSIPPSCVIGSSRKAKWRRGFSEQEFRQIAVELNAAAEAKDTGQGAVYSHLVGFPIVIAGEGKNRVREYQRHNIDIVAQLSTWAMPAPAFLRLCKSPLNSDVCLIRVLPNASVPEGLGTLPFPEFGVPLLERYGVEWDRCWGPRYWRTSSSVVKARLEICAEGWALED
ncbi:hypothetical protein KXJ72_18030 (plasmid) [Comamonas aquatica]|nr:hypothetical protein KXJ72_18030 [Comamonas aquatica]